MDQRAEGVYCHWESYPVNTPGVENNILVIERVNGDSTVTTFSCSRSEAPSILSFLKDADCNFREQINVN